MTVLPGISLYNQDRLTDDDFVDNFVARGETVELLLNVLRNAAAGGETEHQVLIGPRGMGKTSMLRRVAIGIGRDAILCELFVPLRFREEQYNVISLDAFWRNCGEALAEWCEANGCQAMADELDGATESEEWRDAETAATAFLGFCHKLKRRPCLFLDNLDLVLEGLSGAGWKLRHVFQRADGPFVIGAATQPLAQQAYRDDPFYEFFHPVYLEPLSERELLHCMHALADRRGDPGAQVKAVLTNSPERIRTLYALTGGNPRILSLIYLLLEKTDTETVFGDLEALLDQVTPFYKSRIEEYQGAQQRAIIDGIALNWDPITSSALSNMTGIEVTTISSQLARLKRDGFVEQVPTSGARDGYQLSERFLNIWYLMRHGTRKTKQRLRWLAIFLTKLFSAEELGRMAQQARDATKGGRWHPDFRDALIEACGAAGTQDGHIAERLSRGVEVNPAIIEIQELANKALDLFNKEKYEESIIALEKVIDKIILGGQSDLDHLLAQSMYNRGLAFSLLYRASEAIAAYEGVAARFPKNGRPEIDFEVAAALASKGDELRLLDRHQEAIATYGEIERRFEEQAGAPLRFEVLKALFSKSISLSAIGELDSAISAYGSIAARISDAEDPDWQILLGRALFNKGRLQAKMGRDDEAVSTYSEVAVRFINSTNPALQETVARALVAKANSIAALRRFSDAIKIYEEVEERFSGSGDVSQRENVITALLNKGVTLEEMGRDLEAVALYDRVAGEAEQSGRPDTQELVANALISKGRALQNIDRFDEALAVYDVVIKRLGDTPDEPALQELAATALGRSGRILYHHFGHAKRAETYLRRALMFRQDLDDAANLVWSLIAQHLYADAKDARGGLGEIDPEGLALIDSGLELISDNFGVAAELLGKALEAGMQPETSAYFEDILWLLRVAVDKGYGEKLIEWFSSTGHSERYAPIYGALIAHVRGENFLLDLNPEVRPTATDFYNVLSVSGLGGAKPETAPGRPAGRRRK